MQLSTSLFSTTKYAAALLATVVVMGQAAPAMAGRDDHDRGRGHGRWDDGRNWNHDRGHHYGHRPSYYRSSYYYVSPPVVRDRVVIVDRPAYYAPARPVYVDPTPAYRTSSVTCYDSDNRVIATVAGGAAGGLIGTQIGKGSGRTAAIIGGTILGGLVGQSVAYPDRDCVSNVVTYGSVGTPVSWHNPQSGYNYTITPTRDYEQSGRYCREYQAVAAVGGRNRETYGTACMQPDGAWEIVN